MTFERIQEIAEALGWTINKDEDIMDFQQDSSAGEDFYFTAFGSTPDDIVQNVLSHYSDFDVDEHVKQVMDMTGAPSSLSVLIEDSQEIEHNIETLAIALAQNKLPEPEEELPCDWISQLCAGKPADQCLKQLLENVRDYASECNFDARQSFLKTMADGIESIGKE